jgi:methionyl-tRNA formyltransferase
MRIAIAGSGLLAMAMVEAIDGSPHEIIAVIQNGRKTRGRKRRWEFRLPALSRRMTSVRGWARSRKLPVFWLDRMTEEELAPLRALRPHLILVGGFGIILKKPVLELPLVGCLNVHSSLLPRHRGPNPFAAAIAMGDTDSGVTFHIMAEGIDTGDIVDQFDFPIAPDATMLSVYRKSCLVAQGAVVSVLDRIEHDGLHGTPQNEENASYETKVTAKDVFISWESPAQHIDRMVRAYAPSPMPRFHYNGQVVKLARVNYDDEEIEAKPGTVLATQPMLQVATGRGKLTIRVAFSGGRLPWMWPNLLSRPRVGEVLE